MISRTIDILKQKTFTPIVLFGDAAVFYPKFLSELILSIKADWEGQYFYND